VIVTDFDQVGFGVRKMD